MTIATTQPRKRLGQLLLESGQVKEDQLLEALDHQRDGRVRLGRMLVRLGHVAEESVTVALSRQLNLPPVHLDKAPLTPKHTQLLPLDLVERYRAFPIGVSRKHRLLRVATSDPRTEIERALGRATGLRVTLFVTGENALNRAIARYYHGEQDAFPPEVLHDKPSMGVTQVNLAVQFPSKQLRSIKAQNQALQGRMELLERMVATQGFALRGMMELLDQRGVIRRKDLKEQLENVALGRRPPPLPL